jgi:type II secretory pathway pseudopilin PulG
MNAARTQLGAIRQRRAAIEAEQQRLILQENELLQDMLNIHSRYSQYPTSGADSARGVPTEKDARQSNWRFSSAVSDRSLMTNSAGAPSAVGAGREVGPLITGATGTHGSVHQHVGSSMGPDVSTAGPRPDNTRWTLIEPSVPRSSTRIAPSGQTLDLPTGAGSGPSSRFGSGHASVAGLDMGGKRQHGTDEQHVQGDFGGELELASSGVGGMDKSNGAVSSTVSRPAGTGHRRRSQPKLATTDGSLGGAPESKRVAVDRSGEPGAARLRVAERSSKLRASGAAVKADLVGEGARADVPATSPVSPSSMLSPAVVGSASGSLQGQQSGKVDSDDVVGQFLNHRDEPERSVSSSTAIPVKSMSGAHGVSLMILLTTTMHLPCAIHVCLVLVCLHPHTHTR